MYVVSKRSGFAGEDPKYLKGTEWTRSKARADHFDDEDYAAMMAGDWGDYYAMKDMGWHTNVEGIEQ